MKFNAARGRLPGLFDKLWVRIFLNVSIIFLFFVLILSVTNGTLLLNYYCDKQKNLLVTELEEIERLDLSNGTAVTEALSEISDRYNFEIEIYNAGGRILYTTYGSQMMDYFASGRPNFTMLHENLIVLEQEQLSNGVVFEQAVRHFSGDEYLLCHKAVAADVYAEIRIRKELLKSSAAIANEFIVLIAAVCFVLSLVWVFVFARRFSRPIARMNGITRDMSQLNFDRKLEIKRRDEIGQLAASINEMSDSLSAALTDLETTNTRLRDEIELERQLDVMRRGFIANVSHELKTPIAIISGYAEGLKLNVNSESKEQYCNTIIDESRRMNRLVLGILELSKYESGQIPLKNETFDVSELASEMTRRIISKSDVTGESLIPSGSLVFADPMLVEQALKSYLENAAAHTPAGGRVTVSAEEYGGRLRVSVANTGSRVDEAIMPQIWQSFFRGDTSHKREKSRFGLGLSIVSAIMKLHGTDCGVENTEDGVRFWFDLPLPRQEI